MLKFRSSLAINDAEYTWKGLFIETIKDKTANLSGLTTGKYIYVLRVIKLGCSSMNIAVVEVQKDDTEASTKN